MEENGNIRYAYSKLCLSNGWRFSTIRSTSAFLYRTKSILPHLLLFRKSTTEDSLHSAKSTQGGYEVLYAEP